MMKPRRSLPLFWLAISLAACAPTAPMVTPRPVAMLGAPTTLRGIVRDEAGNPVAGVRIAMQGRLNDNTARATAVTGADGAYTVTAPAAAYDMALDVEGSDRFALNYYGPVVVSEGATRDFVLHSAAGMDRSTVFGRLQSRAGVAASGQLVRLRAATAARHGAGAPVEIPTERMAMTDGTGAFSLQLGSDSQEIELDVEMFDATGAMDEFVSVATLGKPTYVEFVTDEIADEDTSPAGRVSAADSAEFERAAAANSEPREGDYPLSTSMTVRSSGYDNYARANRVFDAVNGVIRERRVANSFFVATDILTLPGFGEHYPTAPREQWIALERMFNFNGAGGELGLNRSGKWWYTYRFVFKLRGTIGGKVELYDEAGDLYKLRLDSGVDSAVNYNSRAPDMVRLLFTTDNNLRL